MHYTTSIALQDLTGTVRKTEKEYFAQGNLADIWKGEWQNPISTQTVAVKVIRGAWIDAEHLARLKMKLLREGKVWSVLDHPHITPVFGVCYDLDCRSAPSLVSPYYSNGNLASYIGLNPEADRKKLISQVTAGLAYLHRVGVVHGDIKASNVLINDEQKACLTDFGLSRILEYSGFTTKTVGGTCRWMSYELVAPSEEEGEEEGEEEYTPQLTRASDVWAFSMTVVEILTGRIPFIEFKHDATVILAVMKEQHPARKLCPEISDEVWLVLQKCWTTKPHLRPSMELLALVFDILLLRPLSVVDIMQIIDIAGEGIQLNVYANFLRLFHCRRLGRRVDEQRDSHSAQSPIYALSGNIQRSQPYPCHWPSCDYAFNALSECQSHQLEHFEGLKYLAR